MENNNNIFLGKIEKNGCYVNSGKYGYFLTCQKTIKSSNFTPRKNYKTIKSPNFYSLKK